MHPFLNNKYTSFGANLEGYNPHRREGRQGSRSEDIRRCYSTPSRTGLPSDRHGRTVRVSGRLPGTIICGQSGPGDVGAPVDENRVSLRNDDRE